MRRLAQFVRLRASRVCLSASASVVLCVGRLVRRSSCASRVSRLSVCVCFGRLVRRSSCASVVLSRVCVHLSRVCVHLSRVRLASACVCRLVSRLRAFVSRASCVCLRLFTSRVSNACVLSRVGRLVSRRSSCFASVSRRSSCLALVVLSRVCLSVLVNACGNWLILCVGRHSKGFCYRHTIL